MAKVIGTVVSDTLQGGAGADVMFGGPAKPLTADLSNVVIKNDVAAKITFSGETCKFCLPIRQVLGLAAILLLGSRTLI
jgi:Ca2+-binding RTX toxin-like protein